MQNRDELHRIEDRVPERPLVDLVVNEGRWEPGLQVLRASSVNDELAAAIHDVQDRKKRHKPQGDVDDTEVTQAYRNGITHKMNDKGTQHPHG